ncbi:MAG: hypothetical protein U0798_01500 [Gemmataceae bacterium]
MKQVYATGSLTSQSGTTSKAAIRATSHGTNPEAIQTALSLADYLPPICGGDEPQKKLPVRLSFLSTSQTGRVLTHVAPNGGTYFAHSLLDVPNGTDALTAIQTWGSPDWQRHEMETGAELPEMPFLPVADVLDDQSVKTWLAEESHRDMLEYAFNALLVAAPNGRVVLAASADDVAAVVYAVTRAFPTSLTDDFTFSTYEPDPLSCRARLIGRDPGTDGIDLPDRCYRDENFGFNPSTGRKTTLPRIVGFAKFAVEALAAGQFAELDELRATWQRLHLSDATQFDLVDRIARNAGSIEKAELSTFVQSPAVAQWIAGKPEAVLKLTEWAIEDREFAKGPFSRIVPSIRQKSEAAAKLADAVKVAGYAAVESGDTTKAENAFDVILPMVAPAKAASLWTELPSKVKDPATLAWPMRWHLLPRLIRVKAQSTVGIVPLEIQSWLSVPAEKLSELLAVELPRTHLIHAGREAWKHRQPDTTETLTRAIAGDSALSLALLQPEDSRNESIGHSAALFESLLKVAPERSWFVDVITRANDFPKSLVNRFFEADLAADRADADRVVRTQGESLLELFAGQSGLDTLGLRFLATPPADLLNQKDLCDFLTKLRDQAGSSDALKSRIDAVLTVRKFLESPAFDSETLDAVAKALNLTPSPLPASAKADVFRTTVSALSRLSEQDEFQPSVERAMCHFGETLSKGPTDFFQDLLRDLRKAPEFARSVNLVSSTLAIALGAVKSPELTGKVEGLDPDAFAVASDAARAGKRKMLEEIDRRTAEWPKDARSKWGFLLEAVRPRGQRYGRDFVCMLIGAACVAVAWAVFAFPIR